MSASIAELISDRSAGMPAGERRAAQTLIASYPIIGLKTVADFAQAAGVSSPTILRFVARIGFQNYADFQNRLQEELAAQLQSPSSRAGRLADAGGGNPEFPATVEATIDNIRETFRHFTRRQVDEVAELLASTRGKVVLLGGRFTDPIARYMAAHLKLVRPNVVHLAGQESAWADSMVDIGKRDIVLILDIRRYQESLARFASKANERGAQIVLVTDQWLSPISRFARHVVAARTDVPSPWDSSAVLMVVAETLVAEATRRLGPDSAKRMSEIEALR